MKWITWWYILPQPLAAGVTLDWQIPVYEAPEFCARIRAGEAGKLNVDFLALANHPCTFLSADTRLPASLLQVLPSSTALEIS